MEKRKEGREDEREGGKKEGWELSKTNDAKLNSDKLNAY